MKRPPSHPFILASASPRRRSLLKAAGFRFRVVPSGAREPKHRVPPAELVTRLALLKARDVARRYPDALVLGADTLVFLDDRAIGKPKNAADAARILSRLSGRWQRVLTGIALVHGRSGRKWTAVGRSSVKLRALSAKDIARASRRHLDKAGGYAVQEKGDAFVERIRGDYDNVVGLPVRHVRRLLGVALKALLKGV